MVRLPYNAGMSDRMEWNAKTTSLVVPDWHPCFNAHAHFMVPRLHLPVARYCNIRCRYCSPFRDKSSHDESARPGAAAGVIKIAQALALAHEFLKVHAEGIIGIAGPGEPLANEATYKVLRKVRELHPNARLCLCTNGLALPDAADELSAIGINAITVTVNAIAPEIGAQIYEWVAIDGELLTGRRAARTLWERQREGIARCAMLGIPVKINTVLIPGVNDTHIGDVALAVKDAGAVILNIVPLIPMFDMAGIAAPTHAQLSEVRRQCMHIIPQFRLCKQCRADAVGIPGMGDAKCTDWLTYCKASYTMQVG